MISDTEHQRRWRLVLGGEAEPSCGNLSGADLEMDQVLAALYATDSEGNLPSGRRGGMGQSAPKVARWLGDIRRYFPSSVVQVMQKDALDRLGMREMLLQPEMLEAVQPDVHLVANLISLSGIIPAKTKETARLVVRKVVDDLMRQLAEPMRTAVTGALNRAVRNRRPRLAEIDWNRTIRANLRHYQADYQTVVPESLIGFGRKSQKTQRNIILDKVRDVSMNQTLGQRLVGVGDLSVEALGESGNITLENVDRPRQVADAILDAMRQSRQSSR